MYKLKLDAVANKYYVVNKSSDEDPKDFLTRKELDERINGTVSFLEQQLESTRSLLKQQEDLLASVEEMQANMDKRKNILYCEDTGRIAELLMEKLKHPDLIFTYKRDGMAGIHELVTSETKYDLILTDNQMPGKSGCEMLQAFWTHEDVELSSSTPIDVPIIIHTGCRGSLSLTDEECDKINYIIMKDDFGSVLECIEELLGVDYGRE